MTLWPVQGQNCSVGKLRTLFVGSSIANVERAGGCCDPVDTLLPAHSSIVASFQRSLY